MNSGVLDDWHKTAYTVALYTNYAVTAAAVLGLRVLPTPYAALLRRAVQGYVAIFLVARFWPFGAHLSSFDSFDRQIAFSAGVMIGATMLPISVTRALGGSAFSA